MIQLCVRRCEQRGPLCLCGGVRNVANSLPVVFLISASVLAHIMRSFSENSFNFRSKFYSRYLFESRFDRAPSCSRSKAVLYQQ